MAPKRRSSPKKTKAVVKAVPKAPEATAAKQFCYTHKQDCYQANSTHQSDCNPCCYADKCGNKGTATLLLKCSDCNQASFHESCQVASLVAKGLGLPAEGDSVVCDSCRSAASSDMPDVPSSAAPAVPSAASPADAEHDEQQQQVIDEAAFVLGQALAQAEAEKASAPVPPPAKSDEPGSEYVPLEVSCAYAKVKAGAQDDSLPLQTFCTCTHAVQPPWRPCKHEGCANKFHDLCCATTSFSYGLRDTLLDSETMFCPEHHKELQTQHLKQQIQIKFMTIERKEYLAKKQQEKTDGTDSLEKVPMQVLGVIADVDLATLCGSIPVSEGGFAQRNVASQHASSIEQSIRQDGYMLLAGNLALAELPYSEGEIDELQKHKLLPEDFIPLQPLRELKMETRTGAWLLDFRDPVLRMRDRRFAIIDGNNRVIAIVRISAGDAAFLKNTPLNAYLVDLPIHDGLAVQLASMKCNRLSHQNIEDTIGDTIQQYKNVIGVFEKLHPPPHKKKRATNHQTRRSLSSCNGSWTTDKSLFTCYQQGSRTRRVI